MFRKCFRNASDLIQECFKSVSGMFRECFGNLFGMFWYYFHEDSFSRILVNITMNSVSIEEYKMTSFIFPVSNILNVCSVTVQKQHHFSNNELKVTRINFPSREINWLIFKIITLIQLELSFYGSLLSLLFILDMIT